MENLNKFEKAFLGYKTGKRVCKKYHEIIENKYIKIWGREDYETRKKRTQESLHRHYKYISNNLEHYPKVNRKILEKFESEPDYLHILPGITMSLFYYFKKQGIEIQNIEHFIELCEN